MTPSPFNTTRKANSVADELASAAELVIRQANEGVPAAIIRRYKYLRVRTAKTTQLVRSRDKDLFV